MSHIKAATARRADVAKASEAKAAAEKAAKAEFEAAMAAKAAAEEERKAEMMAGISAGYDKEAAAIRIVFPNLDIQKSGYFELMEIWKRTKDVNQTREP